MKTVYKSGIGWIMWAAFAVLALSVVAVGMDSEWWFTLIFGCVVIGLNVALCLGCWYEIDGNELKVYMFFRPTSLPIDKISEVKYCTGYLASAAMSSKRLAIKFFDRSVLKSAMPLEISPKDRDSFVKKLISINPSIKVYDKAN